MLLHPKTPLLQVTAFEAELQVVRLAPKKFEVEAVVKVPLVEKILVAVAFVVVLLVAVKV